MYLELHFYWHPEVEVVEGRRPAQLDAAPLQVLASTAL